MEEKYLSAIESILFSYSKEIEVKKLQMVLGIEEAKLNELINKLKEKYSDQTSGIELLILEDKVKLVSKKENYKYIYPFLGDEIKPKLTNSMMETLSIIAYNPRITRAEIETIKGVNIDLPLHKLLEYDLVKQAGKSTLPGKPMTYVTTSKFLELFGLSNLDELPELPKYTVDSNAQLSFEED